MRCIRSIFSPLCFYFHSGRFVLLLFFLLQLSVPKVVSHILLPLELFTISKYQNLHANMSIVKYNQLLYFHSKDVENFPCFIF